jgi:hypothetical protein
LQFPSHQRAPLLQTLAQPLLNRMLNMISSSTQVIYQKRNKQTNH